MNDGPKDLDLSQFDPILLESIERSLEPHKRIFSPELIKILREEALIALATDSYSQDLVAKLRARRPVQESGPNPVDDDRCGDGSGVVDPEAPGSNQPTGWKNGSGGSR
jgi:hypothetical protein